MPLVLICAVCLGIIYFFIRIINNVTITKIGKERLRLIKDLAKNEKITCEKIRSMNKKDLKVVKDHIIKYYCELEENSGKEKFEKLLIKRQNYLFREQKSLYGSFKILLNFILNIFFIGVTTYLVNFSMEALVKSTNTLNLVVFIVIAILALVIFTFIGVLIFVASYSLNLVLSTMEGKNDYDLYDFEIKLIDKHLNYISGNDEDGDSFDEIKSEAAISQINNQAKDIDEYTENLVRNKISRHERIRYRKMYRVYGENAFITTIFCDNYIKK